MSIQERQIQPQELFPDLSKRIVEFPQHWPDTEFRLWLAQRGIYLPNDFHLEISYNDFHDFYDISMHSRNKKLVADIIEIIDIYYFIRNNDYTWRWEKDDSGKSIEIPGRRIWVIPWGKVPLSEKNKPEIEDIIL